MCLGAFGSVQARSFTMSKLSFTVAKERLDDSLSCFNLVTDKRNLKLSPKYIGDVGSGIREQLDRNLNLYSHSLGGVMIAYSNMKRLLSYGTIVGSQPCLHVGIQADFIVFKPEVGSTLKGVVNKVFHGHVGCLVHDTFNASIPKQCRDGYSFLETETDLQTGQVILFKVVKVTAQNGVLSMIGCFFEDSFDAPQDNEGPSHQMDRTYDEFDSALQPTTPVILTQEGEKVDQGNGEALEEASLETSQNSLLESGKKKKKKKKKKRGSDENGSGDVSEVVNSQSFTDSSVLDDTQESQPGSEKKKKKHKRKHSEVAEEAEESLNKSEVLPEEDYSEGSAKKKKKKKHKEKREDRDESDNMTLELSGAGDAQTLDKTLDTTCDNDVSVDDSHNSSKKKKKKKHKRSESTSY